MNFSEMPVEIWADLLEEEGQDTTELREWIANGLQVSGSIFYSNEDRSDGYNNGSSDGSGDCYIYGDGSSYDYGYGYNIGYGSGYDYGHGVAIGDGYGYDDSPEDE